MLERQRWFMRHVAAILLLVLLGACRGDESASPGLDGAARAGDVARIRAMASEKSDLDAPSGGNGWTPLMHAIHKNQMGSVEALLDSGADPNRPGDDATTPLMMAAGYGYTDIVTVLLRRGANPALTNTGGETALDWALSGMNDIDRFTMLQCQDETVRALHTAAPRIRPTASAHRIASFKRCGSLVLWAKT